MAMNKTTLANAIVAKLKARNAEITGAKEVDAKALWEDIAGEIIDHIKAGAVITVAAGIPVSTTGTAAAQTGTTQATGTGTVTA